MSRRRTARRPSRLVALLRATLAAVALAALLIGVPLVLITLVGYPLPTEVPDWGEVADRLAQGRITPETQINALSVVAWLAWANLAFSVVVEAFAALRGARPRPLRSLAATQWLAARLVANLALIGSVVVSSSGSAAGALPPLPTAAAMIVEAESAPAVATVDGDDGAEPSEVPEATVLVGRLDTLWSLAEAHLGSGNEWRALRDANVGRTLADGTTLAPGFTQVEKGWTLVVPTSVNAAPAPVSPTSTVAASVPVEVVRGDTLWDLSTEQLAGAEHPAEPADVVRYLDDVVDRNDAAIDDPDLIYPGQVFDFPVPTADGGRHAELDVDDVDAVDDVDDVETGGGDGGPDEDPMPGATELALDVGGGPLAERHELGPDGPTDLPPVVEIVPGVDSGDHARSIPSAPEPVAHVVEPDPSPSAAGTGSLPAPPPTSLPPSAPQPTSFPPAAGAEPPASVAAQPPPSAPSASAAESRPDDGFDLRTGLIHVGSVALGAGGALLAAGALQNVRRRRRYRLAHRSPGRLPTPPPSDLQQIERALNRQGDPETAAWVAAAIGSLAARPVWTGEPIAQPLLATFRADYLEMVFSTADEMAAPLPWATPDGGRTWHLPRLTPIDELPTATAIHPVPTLVTLGVDRLVNLEAVGVLSVAGTGSAPLDLVRSIVHELATSPAAGVIDVRSTVTLAGTEAYGLVRYTEPRHLLQELPAWLDGVEEQLAAEEAGHAYGGRLVVDDDPLGPVVAVVAAADLELLGPLVERAAAGRLPLVMLVVGRADIGEIVEVTPSEVRLSIDDSVFEPQLLSDDTAVALGRLLSDALDAPERPVVVDADLSAPIAGPGGGRRQPRPGAPPRPVTAEDRDEVPRPRAELSRDEEAAAEPEPSMLVRVLGEVTIDGVDEELTSQQLSILSYLACHGPVSRAMLIDALWDGQVISQSRLPNLLTELRARVGRQHLPEAREGRYDVAGIGTDLATFERGVRLSHGLAAVEAVEVLRPALALVRGVPFTPPSRRFWSWVSDESHLAAHVEAVVADTALRLAALERELGDIERAQWACQQGLLASPTDESLVVALTELYVAQGKPGLARRLVEGWEARISRLECGDPSDEPRRRLAG